MDASATARSRLVAFLLLLASVAILAFDLDGLSGWRAESADALKATDGARQAFGILSQDGLNLLASQYATSVAEIRLRIEQEHLLFALKFVLVGGTLYILLHGAHKHEIDVVAITPLAALITWAAVVVATVVDMRVTANQAFIGTLGKWVRQYEELTLGSASRSLGWEAFLDAELISRAFYPALRVSGQVLTVVLFAVTAAIFLLSRLRMSSRVALITGLSASLSVVLMWFASVSRAQSAGGKTAYVIAAVFGIGITGYLAYRSRSDHSSASVAVADSDG